MTPNKITTESIRSYRDYYANDPMRQALTTMLAKGNLADLTFVTAAARKMQFQFSVDVKTMSSTNQKSSGRCWLFAAANVLREIVAKKLNLENFELSQSWLAFWDKFERVNAYLNAIVETADLPHDDRLVDHLVATGVHDGGQWDMFVNIVDKYGILPKNAYPETAQTSATGQLNRHINNYLKASAGKLRRAAAAGEDTAAMREEILCRVFSFLCACYGEPPETFDWEYKDKDGAIHYMTGKTPIQFRDEFIGDYLDHYVSIINAPTEDKPFYKTYTVQYLNNVPGGKQDILYYNLPIDEFKELVIRQLKDGEIVWFGSDCGKYSDRETKAWDDASFNEGQITGFDYSMTKEEMLWYHMSQMNHAMCITGVNIGEDGKPNRWKIQNSWGADGANGGYYMASDTWFDKFVYQAVVNKAYLEAHDLAQKPIELKPWDPMGSLALTD